MNNSARRALVAVMTGDATLNSLLSPDPKNPGKGLILLEDTSLVPSAYPCVTYRFFDAVPDPRFAPTIVEGGGQSKQQTARAEIRCYTKQTAQERDTISEQVKTLLTGVRIPFTGGVIHFTQLQTELSDKPDYNRNARFNLLRFQLWLAFP